MRLLTVVENVAAVLELIFFVLKAIMGATKCFLARFLTV